MVLGLPLLATLLHMTPHGFGILAGLTVYAVPQVLAATAPVSSVSAQVGTLVKLVRVLMLGPVVMVLSLIVRRGRGGGARAPSLATLVPWFIVGFLLLLAARSAGLLPQAALRPTEAVAGVLTVVSMAALGLGVDVRALARAGLRVSAVVTLSLLGLGLAAFLLVLLLRPPEAEGSPGRAGHATAVRAAATAGGKERVTWAWMRSPIARRCPGSAPR